MTTDKRWNIQTDLVYTETFYERQTDGTLLKVPVPGAEIDIRIEYFTDGGCKYEVSRIDGIYQGCRQIDEYSLEIFIPLSRLSMRPGVFGRNLRLTIPDENFMDQVKNLCFPAKTGLFLWFGPTDDIEQSPYGEAIVATIINASYDVIDLTGEAYPDTCRRIFAKLDIGIPANIYVKESDELPQRAIAQIRKTETGYRLFSGIFETEEFEGGIKTFRVYYDMIREDCSIVKGKEELFPELAPAGEYVKRSDFLIINGGCPNDILQ